MKIGKYILLISLAGIAMGGCSGTNDMWQTSIASENPEYRELKGFCEQEALGRCWTVVDSSPLWLNEIWESFKQSTCKREWISACMEKYGNGEQHF